MCLKTPCKVGSLLSCKVENFLDTNRENPFFCPLYEASFRGETRFKSVVCNLFLHITMIAQAGKLPDGNTAVAHAGRALMCDLDLCFWLFHTVLVTDSLTCPNTHNTHYLDSICHADVCSVTCPTDSIKAWIDLILCHDRIAGTRGSQIARHCHYQERRQRCGQEYFSVEAIYLSSACSCKKGLKRGLKAPIDRCSLGNTVKVLLHNHKPDVCCRLLHWRVAWIA